MTHPHIDPPPIPLIKETHDGKSDKYFVKLKLRRYPTSSRSDLYEFKMSLFDNGNPEHRWELPGNNPVFTVVMVICYYVERIRRILVTSVF